MDTNEEHEKYNAVLELLIRPPEPYSSSFNYEFSEQGLYLESFPSLWKKEDDHEHLQTFKRRRLEKLTSSFLRPLDKDTLLHVLSLLDFPSLIRCMSVERSLKKMIRSVELRRMWSQNQSPVVLISSYTLPCKLWLPGTTPSTTRVFQPLSAGLVSGSPTKNPLVVASHRGLVCIRFQYRWSQALDLAVGNPLTGEWVALPRSVDFQDLTGYSYKMEVGEPLSYDDHSMVGFKVAGFCPSGKDHCYHIFDSATGEWSSTMLEFPPKAACKWSAFDLRSNSWRIGLIRRWDIKTGLERSPSEVHRLPYPSLHGFSQWEYKGRSYFASAWTVQQPRYEPKQDSCGEFAGYGVWEVMKEDGGLKTISAVWGPEVGASLLAIRENVWVRCYGVNCSACDNLVWFDGESRLSPTMPVVFYDIEMGKWSWFDEQHQAPDMDTPADHYAAAVVYTPSLLVAPTRSFRSSDKAGPIGSKVEGHGSGTPISSLSGSWLRACSNLHPTKAASADDPVQC